MKINTDITTTLSYETVFNIISKYNSFKNIRPIKPIYIHEIFESNLKNKTLKYKNMKPEFIKKASKDWKELSDAFENLNPYETLHLLGKQIEAFEYVNSTHSHLDGQTTIPLYLFLDVCEFIKLNERKNMLLNSHFSKLDVAFMIDDFPSFRSKHIKG